jgi:hypothetical protein
VTTSRVLLDEGASALVDIARFDELDRDRAVQLLQACCPGRRWVNEVVSGRPYASMREVLTASDDVLADLSWSDVVAAMLAHAAASEARAGDLDVLRDALREPTPHGRALVRAELRQIVRLAVVTRLR